MSDPRIPRSTQEVDVQASLAILDITSLAKTLLPDQAALLVPATQSLLRLLALMRSIDPDHPPFSSKITTVAKQPPH